MVSKVRAERIAESIQHQLAEMLLWDVIDPRVQGLTVTDVRVDRELSYANIFVSALEGIERKDEILAGLKHARGFLRSQLSKRIPMRSFPQLRFHWDPTPEQAARIEDLLDSLREEAIDEEPS